MGGFDYTNNHLIESIKRRGSIPTVQELFDDDDFLTLADEELQDTILPMIMSIKGDYFVANSDTVMTSETVYPIPSDAIGLKIKDLYWLQNSPFQRFVQITQLNQTDIAKQWAGGYASWGFYIEGNNIILVPSAFVGQTLRIKYYKRASKLVTNDQGGQISSINTLTNEVTLTNVPATFAVGTKLSAIDNKPGFETKASGLTITNLAAPIITLDDVTDLANDYWMCLDGESTIPQITPEAMPILAQAVVVKCMEAMNDPGIGNAQAKLGESVQTFLGNMVPRVDAQPKIIVNRSGVLAWKKINRYWGAK